MGLASKGQRNPRRGLYPLSRGLALVGMVGLLGIAFVTVTEVLSRWLFSAPIYGSENIIELAVPLIIACSFPATLLQDQNITIRFLGKALGRPCDDWLEMLGTVTTLVFFGVLAWQVAVYAGELAADHRVTEIIRIPVAPTWWVAAAVLAACVPVLVVVLMARVGQYRGAIYEELSAETVSDAVEREGLNQPSRD